MIIMGPPAHTPPVLGIQHQISIPQIFEVNHFQKSISE